MWTPGISASPASSRAASVRSYACIAAIAACNSSRRPVMPGKVAAYWSTKGRPDFGDVLQRADQTREAFVIERPRLPLVRWRVLRRAHLVRRDGLQQRQPSVEHAQMRPEELVGRANEEVAAERLHVNWAVWRELHRVDEGMRPDLARPANHRRHVVDRPDRVGGVAHRDELRLLV